jgi:hypothetical protein
VGGNEEGVTHHPSLGKGLLQTAGGPGLSACFSLRKQDPLCEKRKASAMLGLLLRKSLRAGCSSFPTSDLLPLLGLEKKGSQGRPT